jgi:heptosyltransferase-2
MQKFLVIQTAFIGDVVLATAILEELHARFPDAQIDYLVRKGNEGLLKGHPFLHEVLVWDKQKQKFSHLMQMMRKVRSAHYDVVINVQRFTATGLITIKSGAKLTIGYDKNPLSFLFSRKIPHVISTKENPIHEIDRCHALVAALTGYDHAFKPRLYPTDGDMAAVAQYKHGAYICIAPASVWFTKQYPAHQWASFIRRIPPNVQVYLLGAPADAELCEGIIQSTPGHAVHNLAGKLSLLQSVALQKDAMMNYVNDSAPMHFASAVNAPVTAVYCSTIPGLWLRPRFRRKSYRGSAGTTRLPSLRVAW